MMQSEWKLRFWCIWWLKLGTKTQKSFVSKQNDLHSAASAPLALVLNGRKKIFIDSWQFNVEEINHIPLQSMLDWNSELCVFVRFVSALLSFSINCLHPFHHEYDWYVRYDNDNVILFIGYSFSFSNSEPKQVSYKCIMYKKFA